MPAGQSYTLFKSKRSKITFKRCLIAADIAYRPATPRMKSMRPAIAQCLDNTVVAARVFKVCVEHIKVKFYHVFNCVYSRAKAVNS